jgi:hypothetical protein
MHYPPMIIVPHLSARQLAHIPRRSRVIHARKMARLPGLLPRICGAPQRRTLWEEPGLRRTVPRRHLAAHRRPGTAAGGRFHQRHAHGIRRRRDGLLVLVLLLLLVLLPVAALVVRVARRRGGCHGRRGGCWLLHRHSRTGRLPPPPPEQAEDPAGKDGDDGYAAHHTAGDRSDVRSSAFRFIGRRGRAWYCGAASQRLGRQDHRAPLSLACLAEISGVVRPRRPRNHNPGAILANSPHSRQGVIEGISSRSLGALSVSWFPCNSVATLNPMARTRLAHGSKTAPTCRRCWTSSIPSWKPRYRAMLWSRLSPHTPHLVRDSNRPIPRRSDRR